MKRRPQVATSVGGLFVLAYLATTVVNSAVTLVYTVAAHTPSSEELGVSYLNDPAYQATVKWHPAIALAIWAGAAALWFRRHALDRVREALRVGAVWTVAAVVVDLVLWVVLLGDTRWGLPAHDFYIANEPWIGLTYAAILLSPLCVLAWTRRARHRAGSPTRGLPA